MSWKQGQKVKEIFNSALEFNSGERPTFLTGRAHETPTLRRNVEDLLAFHKTDFLESNFDDAKDMTPASGRFAPPPKDQSFRDREKYRSKIPTDFQYITSPLALRKWEIFVTKNFLDEGLTNTDGPGQ